MSGDMMTFPEKPEEFIKQYSFTDKERVYTNGSELIPVFRVRQMLEHYTRKPMERIIERICNVRNNTPSTDFKNGCNASLHQIHREIDIKVKEEGGIE
jgi:hypothetical protein